MKRRKSARPRPIRPPKASPDTRPSEQLLVEIVGELPPGPVLCTTVGRGQFAQAAARLRPTEPVTCCFLDLHALRQANSAFPETPPNLRLLCAADFPEEEIDAFVLPVMSSGEAELVRDFLQAGHTRLRAGGRMVLATDNPGDTWLHDELRKMFEKVTRRPSEKGTVYLATKTEPLRKIKSYECRFAFRDEGHLIEAVSRPGVFSHRRVDAGARALMRAAVVRPGERVLELGCGSGVVSMALAQRAADVVFHAIDSNVRAVECTRRGVAINSLSNLNVHLTTAEAAMDLQELSDGLFDLVVGNPPYYSNHRIAAIFAACAFRALKDSGTALFVAKRAEWYEEHLPRWFSTIAVEPVGEYQVIRATGVRRSTPR